MTEEATEQQPIQTVTLTFVQVSEDELQLSQSVEPLTNGESNQVHWSDATDALKTAALCHRLFKAMRKVGGPDNLVGFVSMMEQAVDVVLQAEAMDEKEDADEH